MFVTNKTCQKYTSAVPIVGMECCLWHRSHKGHISKKHFVKDPSKQQHDASRCPYPGSSEMIFSTLMKLREISACEFMLKTKNKTQNKKSLLRIHVF